MTVENQLSPKPRRSMREAFRDDVPAPAGEPTAMLNMKISANVHHRLKMKAVSEGRPMREIVESLVRDYLGM